MPEFGLTYLPPLRSCSLYLRVQEQEKRGARLGQFSFKIPEFLLAEILFAVFRACFETRMQGCGTFQLEDCAHAILEHK